MVVGDKAYGEAVHECGIVDEPPNLAARLQAIAKPDTVVIAKNTRNLLGNLFELEDLGTKDFTGVADPVHAWRALRPSPAAGRFEAFHATGLTALVGREEELEILLRRWSRAKSPSNAVRKRWRRLFGPIVDGVPNLRVLLIVTFRPEFEPPWIGRPYVTALTINRLTERQVSAMIDRVIGDKLLPATLRQEIIERTDGIPLFVEEMTKAVLEAENEGEARTVAAVPSPVLAVPASLHASLMARLDRLGPAKEVAQIGPARKIF